MTIVFSFHDNDHDGRLDLVGFRALYSSFERNAAEHGTFLDNRDDQI